MENKEFNVGDVVTLDRYNHKDDVSKGVVVGYGRMLLSNRLTYKVEVNNLVIHTTGASIVESKNYEPVPDNERHAKIFRRQVGEIDY